MSTRCTRCGKNKRPIEDIRSMEDNELWEIFDGFWSPLESLQIKPASRPVPSDSANVSSRVILLDLVATTGESSNKPARPQKKNKTGHQEARERTIRRKTKLSSGGFMQNFVKGMAVAFGGGLVPATERMTYASPCLEDFEVRNPRQRLPSSSSRLRVLISRLRPTSQTVPPERRPLTAEWYESLTAPYVPMQSTFQLQNYW